MLRVGLAPGQAGGLLLGAAEARLQQHQPFQGLVQHPLFHRALIVHGLEGVHCGYTAA